MSALLDQRFTTLSDVQTSLVGDELLRVNAAGTAVELVAVTAIPGFVETFVELTDTPSTYAGSAGYIVRVKGDEEGLEFVEVTDVVDTSGTPTLLATFLDLTDTPASYSGADNQLVRVSVSTLTFYAPTFLDLVDTSVSYGPPGSFLRVDTSASALTFVSRVLSFTGLDDTPSTYGASDEGKIVKVKTDLTGLEFGLLTFLSLEDTPASYAGQANRVLRVDASASGLTFLPENYTTFVSLLDTPGSYGIDDGGKFLVVEPVSSPTGLVFRSAVEISATAQSFLTLTDTPSTYVDAIGKFVRVTPLPDGTTVLRFADVSVLSSDAAQADLNLYKEEFQGGTSPSATGGNAVAIGEANVATAQGSSVIGGRSNTASGFGSTIVGGFTNTLSGAGVIAGGTLNNVTGTVTYSLIGGGSSNTINGADKATIGTGLSNQIEGANSGFSVIGGGLTNSINLSSSHGTYEGAIVCGGQRNVVTGDGAVVLAGYFTTVTSPKSVAVTSQSGINNGPRAAVSGDYSVVLGPQCVTDRGWFGNRPFANEPGEWRRSAGIARTSFFGEIQSSILLFAGSTQSDSWTRLSLDSNINYGDRRDVAGGYLSRMTFPADDGVYLIKAEVVGRDTAAPHSATFDLRAMVMVDGGQVSLPSGFEFTSVCRCGVGSAGWDVKITAAGLVVDIEVKGRVAQSVKWVCKVKTLELVVKQDVAESFTLTPINDFVDGGYTVNENSAGASIVTISRDGGLAGFTFTSGNSNFEITEAGVFKLRAGRTLNFETTPFLTVVVYANSAEENDYFTIPIRVLNVNEAPSNIILTSVATGSTTTRNVVSGVPGQRVAYVTVVDVDSATHTLDILIAGATFEIIQETFNGATRNVLKLRDGASIATTTLVQIRATDPDGLSRTQNFNVGVVT